MYKYVLHQAVMWRKQNNVCPTTTSVSVKLIYAMNVLRKRYKKHIPTDYYVYFIIIHRTLQFYKYSNI